MKPYTLTHSAKKTLIAVTYKKGGFSEILQFEFRGLLTDHEVNKVYNDLSDEQKKTLDTNKNVFKQFIRAINLRYPTATKTDTPTAKSKLLAEQKTFISSRLAKYLNIGSNDAAKATIGFGTISDEKMNKQIKNKDDGILLESEDLTYWNNNGFVFVVKNTPIYTTESGNDVYIYVILLLS